MILSAFHSLKPLESRGLKEKCALLEVCFNMPRKATKWIRGANPNPGALHRQLGYASSKEIPEGLKKEIYHANIGTHVRGHKVTPLLKHRVVFAVNAQKRRR